MRRGVAIVGVVALLVAGCAGGGPDPEAAESPSPTVAASPTTEGPPRTDASTTTEPSPAMEPSPTIDPPPPAPLRWSEPALLPEDSPLQVRATAVAGPGGHVGHRAVSRTIEDGPVALLLSSSDGVSWDTVLERTGLEIDGLLAGGVGYVVIGTRHLPRGDADRHLAPWAAWSADGLTWQEVDVPLPGELDGSATTGGELGIEGAWLHELVAAPTGFVALGHSQAPGRRNVLWTSTDGTAWELQPRDPFSGEAVVRGVVGGEDGYVAHGNADGPGDAPGPLLAWYSDDALTWTPAVGHGTFRGESGEGPRVAGVVAVGDGFVMVDVGIVRPPRAWRSADGSTWEAPVTLPSLGELSATISTVSASGGRILAAGREIADDEGLEPGVQYPGLWSSIDGTSWEQVPPEQLRGGLTDDGVTIDTLAPLDDEWLALGRVWDYPDEIPTAVAWVGR